MRAIALGVVMSVALVACSGDDDTTSAAGDGDTTTTTTTTPVTEPDADATTTTAGPGGDGTTGTTAAGTGDVPATAPQPAAVGRYRYQLEQEGQAPTETFLIVQPGEETDGGTYQGHTFAFDGRRRIVRFGPEGEVVESVEVVGDDKYAGASYVCDWEPDATAIPSGSLDPGRTWSSETMCTFTVDGQDVRHEVTERREVVARRTVPVGGRQVEVVEIRRVTRLEATGGSDFSQEVTATDLYAPSLGLTVQTEGTVTISSGGDRASERVVLRLLEPEPTAG